MADALACEESPVAVCALLQTRQAGVAPELPIPADLRRVRERLADAAASGFAGQRHMTRIFARQFGFTPGALRRATQP